MTVSLHLADDSKSVRLASTQCVQTVVARLQLEVTKEMADALEVWLGEGLSQSNVAGLEAVCLQLSKVYATNSQNRCAV